jgi:hypothetical protein
MSYPGGRHVSDGAGDRRPFRGCRRLLGRPRIEARRERAEGGTECSQGNQHHGESAAAKLTALVQRPDAERTAMIVRSRHCRAAGRDRVSQVDGVRQHSLGDQRLLPVRGPPPSGMLGTDH